MQCALGVCLAAAFWHNFPSAGSRQMGDKNPAPPASSKPPVGRLLFGFYAAGFLFLLLSGLVLNVAYPKIMPRNISSNLHYLMLLCPLVIGFLLDRTPRSLALISGMLALLALGSGLINLDKR